MKRIATLCVILLFAFTTQMLFAQPWYARGDFNGWSGTAEELVDDGTNGDVTAGDGIFSRLITIPTTGRYEYKVTVDDWSTNYPASNSWFFTTIDNQEVLITYDSNSYGDGWLPDVNIVNADDQPTANFVAVGDHNGWNNGGSGMTGSGDLLPMDVNPGDMIRISVWLKANNLEPDSAALYPTTWAVGFTYGFWKGVGNNDGFNNIAGYPIDMQFVLPSVTSFDWTQYFIDVQVPNDPEAVAISVRLHVFARFTGTVYWDDLKVENLDVPVLNVTGGFEGDLPSYWMKGAEPSGSTLEWATDQSRSMGKSLKITKGVTSEAAVWESENMADFWSPQHLKNVDIKIGAWVRTEGVNTNPANDDERWQVSYSFYNEAGTLIGETVMDLDQSTASSGAFYADTNGVGETILPVDSWTTIIKFIGGKDATGTVWADDFMLYGRNLIWAGQDWNTAVGVPTGWIYWFPPIGGNDGEITKGFENTVVTTEEAHSGLNSLKFDLPLNREPHDAFVGTKRMLFQEAGLEIMHDDGLDGDWQAGDGVYVYHAVIDTAGSYNWKAVISGSWDAWGSDNRAINADNIGYSTGTSNEDVFFYLDINNGRVFTSSVPLPVELVSFSASVSGTTVNLQWQTATELNNSGFAVERKTNNYWAQIGFVNGHGTTTEPQNYFYNDQLSNINSNKIYYRLKQIDFDGTFEYSNIVEVDIVPVKFSLSQNYPNPFNPSTKITYTLASKSAVTLKVYDIIGNEVATLVNQEQETGSYEINFDAALLTSGVYFYKINASNFVSVKKMLLLK